VDDTLYLNAARCPRVVEMGGKALRNFSVVTLRGDVAIGAGLIWVDAEGQICSEEPYLLC
jgi:hypothetical protein